VTPAMHRPPRARTPDDTVVGGRRTSRCGVPGCKEPKAPGRHVCPAHAGLYADIRERMERETSRTSRYRRKGRRRWSPGTCAFPHCFETAERDSEFCEAHSDESIEELYG
jgi:hypothetical protein